MQYKHLFFDLDRTLWDFESNSTRTFQIIFEKRQLNQIFPDFESFVSCYKKNNEALWDLYRLGEINKATLRDERFKRTLQDFEVENLALAEQLSKDYIEIIAEQKGLFPNTIESLEYLKNKYQLYIITNGFKEVQHKKLNNSGIMKYFSRIICSEEAHANKPKPEIFHFALSSANAKKSESIMIGDDLKIDILGAKNYGIDQVFFNPKKTAHSEQITYEINQLSQLKDIL